MILLDLGLPDLDGLELARRLREWSTTPIIVISARGQEEDKVGALDAGADVMIKDGEVIGNGMLPVIPGPQPVR